MIHGFLIAMALAATIAAFLVLACCLCAVSGSAMEDGERGMWALCPPEQKAWGTLGLLMHALQREQAAAVERQMRDE